MSSAIVPVYARSRRRLRARRRLLADCDEPASDISTFGAGIAVNVLGHAHPRLVARPDRAGRQDLAQLQPVPDPRRRTAGAAARRRDLRRPRLLHQFGGRGQRGRRSRWRGGAMRSTAIRRNTASSPSKAPSTAARWRRSPPAARPSNIEGFGPKVDGFDQIPVTTSPRSRRRSARELARS